MEISDVKLAGALALATFFGSGAERIVSSIFTDANVQREYSAQMVDVALTILSAPIQGEGYAMDEPEALLRAWAFDTLNVAADVELPDAARTTIVSGTTAFIPTQSYINHIAEISRRAVELSRDPQGAIRPNYPENFGEILERTQPTDAP